MSRYWGWYHMAPVLTAAALISLPTPRHRCANHGVTQIFSDCVQEDHGHLEKWVQVPYGSGLVWKALSWWAILTITVLGSHRSLIRLMGHDASLEYYLSLTKVRSHHSLPQQEEPVFSDI